VRLRSRSPGASLAAAVAVLVAALAVGCGRDDDLAEITFTAGADGAAASVWVPINEPRSAGTYRAEVDWGDATERLEAARDGMLAGAWMEDLTSDGSPELVVALSSAGSGSYGAAHVYTRVDSGAKRLELAPLGEGQRVGYMGHDVFDVEDGVLLREFPIYLVEDTNASPGGGVARFRYSFEENAWRSMDS